MKEQLIHAWEAGEHYPTLPEYHLELVLLIEDEHDDSPAEAQPVNEQLDGDPQCR